MNSTLQKSVTSTFLNRLHLYYIWYNGIGEVMVSYMGFFFSCANYQVQEETMGLFLALENLQWANNYHQASF